MSNILKPSAYLFNARNGTPGAFADHIKTTREFGPLITENEASVVYLFNCWARFDASVFSPENRHQGLFNFGNRFFCNLRFIGAAPPSTVRLEVSDWKNFGAVPARETFESDLLASAFGVWEMWSVAIFGAHNFNGENIKLYRNGESLNVTPSAGAGTSLVFPQEAWWTVSSGRSWPLGGGGGADIEYYAADLNAELTDVSVFVKEDLDFSTIVSFLYNKGIGADASEYDTSDGSRLGLYLPLRDGWMNTRRPGSGRVFADADGVFANGNFYSARNTTSRIFSCQGGGKRQLTNKDLYLSHTRSDNKFVCRSVPAFTHQNAWISRSIPVTDFPDAEGI